VNRELTVVWDAQTGERLRTLPGHGLDRNVVQTVSLGLAFSPDGGRLAVGRAEGKLGKLGVWDVDRGEELVTLTGNPLGPAVAFSADGRRIARGGLDGVVTVWDVGTGKEMLSLRQERGVWGVAFGRDGRQVLSFTADGTLRLWDAGDARELLAVPGAASDELGDLVVSPDGLRLVAAHAPWESVRARVTVQVWDFQECLRALAPPAEVIADSASRTGLRVADLDVVPARPKGSSRLGR
jgi:WD40 repeat protein